MSWKTWNGDQLIRRTYHGVARGVEDAVNAIGEIADTQVPHDEGTLQQSKFIIQDPGDMTTWIISYGGGPGTGFPRVPYALRWHETPANFQKGRKWKYLRDPVLQQGPNILVRSVTENVRQAWN